MLSQQTQQAMARAKAPGGTGPFFLSETHLTNASTPTLPIHLFSQWDSAIAILKNFLFQPMAHYTDSQGQYVFLKGTIMGQVYTFATLCYPLCLNFQQPGPD